MRKSIAWLLLLMMVTLTVPAMAQTEYTMAGFDESSVGHVWETSLFFQRMEEKTGVHFTFAQSTDYATWTKAKTDMFASGVLPDVLFKAELTVEETQKYYEAGQLIDLKPYLAEYAPNLTAMLSEHPDWEKAITLPDGAIVALPTINPLQNNNAMWINKAWLDQLGLAMPTDAASLKAVLEAFKTGDPNKNGKSDEIPLTFMSMWDLKFLGHAFGLVSNDYGVYLSGDGQVETTLNKDENRAFLTWLNSLWTEKLLDQNGFTSADSLRQITDSKADITYGVIFGTTPLNLVPSSALNQYVMLEPLTYEGKQVYRDLLGDVVRGTFAITSACEDPAKLIAWVDSLYTEEGSRLTQAGVEGTEYVWNDDGTWMWKDEVETVANTVLAQATIADGGNMPGLVSDAFQLAYENSETHALLLSLQKLKGLSVYPYPQVYLTDEKQSRVNEIQLSLGKYAETAMIRFVTGDVELSDAEWERYKTELGQLQLEEMLNIWQEAVK